MISITRDTIGYLPFDADLIISKKIKDDKKAQDEFINLLSDEKINHDVSNLSDEEKSNYVASQRYKYYYHPLVWEES